MLNFFFHKRSLNLTWLGGWPSFPGQLFSVKKRGLRVMSARENKKMTEERSILLLKCPKAWLLSQRPSNPFWRLAQIWTTKQSINWSCYQLWYWRTSFSPLRSHGAGRYNVSCGPRFQYLPKLCPLMNTTPLVQPFMYRKLSFGLSVIPNIPR